MAVNSKVENQLLATHLSTSKDFERACMSGNAHMIMESVSVVMSSYDLHTKGAQKLRDDIYRMTRGKDRLTTYECNNILMFVWNSRLAGCGMAVI